MFVCQTLARSLQQLLDFEGDVEETFAQSFQISYQDVFGDLVTHPLKPDGDTCPVTNNNRQVLNSSFTLPCRMCVVINAI